MKPIVSIGNVPDKKATVVKSGPKEFLVYRDGGRVSVCGNLCPHHGARLSDGKVRNGVLTCPRHHARFDIHTGDLLSPPALDGITIYQSEVVDGEICVGRPNVSMPARVVPESKPHFVIIGSGAAGIACAEALRGRGFVGRISVLSKDSQPPYDRTSLTTGLLNGSLNEPELLRAPGFFEYLGIEVLTETVVESVDREKRTLGFADGGGCSYDRLLIASGADSRALLVPGEDIDGISRLRSAFDAARFRDSVSHAESVVIIGAGFLGLEAGFSIAATGKKVHVAAPEQYPLEIPLGSGYARRIIDLMAKDGIDWHPGCRVEKFEGDRALQRVGFANGDTIDAQAALVAVGAIHGQLPGGISGTGWLDDNGGILVDPRFSTPDPAIFAAGDVLGGSTQAGHWVTAMRQGRHAAAGMMGQTVEYREVPFFWSDLGGETVRVIGRPTGSEPVVEFGSIESGDFLATWRSQSRITGAFAVGYAPELINLENDMREGSQSL